MLCSVKFGSFSIFFFFFLKLKKMSFVVGIELIEFQKTGCSKLNKVASGLHGPLGCKCVMPKRRDMPYLLNNCWGKFCEGPIEL